MVFPALALWRRAASCYVHAAPLTTSMPVTGHRVREQASRRARAEVQVWRPANLNAPWGGAMCCHLYARRPHEHENGAQRSGPRAGAPQPALMGSRTASPRPGEPEDGDLLTQTPGRPTGWLSLSDTMSLSEALIDVRPPPPTCP